MRNKPNESPQTTGLRLPFSLSTSLGARRQLFRQNKVVVEFTLARQQVQMAWWRLFAFLFFVCFSARLSKGASLEGETLNG